MFKFYIIALAVLITAISSAANAGELFDRNLSSWTQVSDPASTNPTQWSIVGDSDGVFRLDLRINSDRTVYFVISRPCENGYVAIQRILPGNQPGIGLDCDGKIVFDLLATKQLYFDQLPPAARALFE